MTMSWIFYKGHDLDRDQHIEAFMVNGQLLVTSEDTANREKRSENKHHWGKNAVTLESAHLRESVHLGLKLESDAEIQEALCSVDAELCSDSYVGRGWRDGIAHEAHSYLHTSPGADYSCMEFMVHCNPSGRYGWSAQKRLTLRLDCWQDILGEWDKYANLDGYNGGHTFNVVEASSVVYQTPIEYSSDNPWLKD